MSSLSETDRHRSSSRSTTPGVGSLATTRPLRAPTEVPRIRSGATSYSKSARTMPTSTAPSRPPPPSTKAVRSAISSGAGGEKVCVLAAYALGDAALDPEDQDRHQPGEQHEQGEREGPAQAA